jgi:hypothetical protein
MNHPWQWLLTFLRQVDWMDRYTILTKLKYTKRHIYNKIIKHLGPDEAIHGTDSAPKIPMRAQMTIPLHDKDRRTQRQTKITEFFNQR